MKSDTHIRSAPRRRRKVDLIALSLAVAALLAAPVVSGANQVYKACGKKWARQAKKLPPEQLSWMLEQSSSETTADLDGDGALDTLTMTSTPSFRNCDVKSTWNEKETTIRIEYGNGRRKLFHWIGDLLVGKMRLYTGLGKILVSGTDAEGNPFSKWVVYGSARAVPATAVARTRPAAAPAEEETVRVAGMQ